MTAITDTEAVELIAEALLDAADSITEWARTHDDVEAALRVRAAVDDARKILADADHAANINLLTMPVGEPLRVPGVGEAVVTVAGKQVTDGARLARHVAGHAADAYSMGPDGEPVPPAVLCARVADELVTVFGLDNASATFRASEVKRRRMRPGDFRSYEDSAAKVAFQRIS